MDVEEAIRTTFYHSLRYHPIYGKVHPVTVKVKNGVLIQDTDCIAGDVFASIYQSFIKYVKYEDVVGLFFEKHPYKGEADEA